MATVHGTVADARERQPEKKDNNTAAIIGGAIIIAITVAVCLVFPGAAKAGLVAGAIAWAVEWLWKRGPGSKVIAMGIVAVALMAVFSGCASSMEAPDGHRATWNAIWAAPPGALADLEDHPCYGAIDQTMFVIGAPESYLASETECEEGRGCAYAGWPEGDPVGRYTVATWDGLTPAEEAEEVEHQLRHVAARCLAHSGVEWAEEHPPEVFGT